MVSWGQWELVPKPQGASSHNINCCTNLHHKSPQDITRILQAANPMFCDLQAGQWAGMEFYGSVRKSRSGRCFLSDMSNSNVALMTLGSFKPFYLYMQQLKMLPQVLAWPGDAPASKVMASCLRNGSVYFDGKNMEQISGNLIWIYLNLWDIHLAFFRLSGFSSASFSVPPHLPNSFVRVITWCGFNFPMPQIIQELGLQHLKSPGVGWKQYLLGMLAHSPSTDPRSFRSLF